MWDDFQRPETKFPITFPLALTLMCCTSPIKKAITKWLNYKIPIWQWESAKTRFTDYCGFLRKLNIVEKKKPALSKLGKICFSLFDEGDPCILAGYLYMYKNDLSDIIKSKQDFLYICTHFLKKWRCVWKGLPTLKTDRSIRISPEVIELLSNIQQSLKAMDIPDFNLIESSELTSFYVVFPNITAFISDRLFKSDLLNFASHFVQKMRLFQETTNLPFGTEAIESIHNSLQNFIT